MSIQVISLLLYLMSSSGGISDFQVEKHGNEAIIQIDGQEYRMIQTVIGEAISTPSLEVIIQP